MNKRTIVSIVFLCFSVTSFAQKTFVIWDTLIPQHKFL